MLSVVNSVHQFGNNALHVQFTIDREDFSYSSFVIRNEEGERVARYSPSTGPEILHAKYNNEYFAGCVAKIRLDKKIPVPASCLLQRFVEDVGAAQGKGALSQLAGYGQPARAEIGKSPYDLADNGIHFRFMYSDSPEESCLLASMDGLILFECDAASESASLCRSFGLRKVRSFLDRSHKNKKNPLQVRLLAMNSLQMLPDTQEELEARVFSAEQEMLARDEKNYWLNVARELGVSPGVFNWL